MAGTFPVPLGEGRCCAHLVKGVGGMGVKGDGNTEQLQCRAYKYTPTAVGWWAVEAQLHLFAASSNKQAFGGTLHSCTKSSRT